MNLRDYSFQTHSGGLVLSTQKVPNGNMVGATGQFITLMPFLGGIELYVQGLMDCEKLPGVFSRDQKYLYNTSIDDYLEATSIPHIAARCLDTAIYHYGFLDLFYPKVSFEQWVLRFQGFWQHMKISAGRFVGPIGRIMWAASIVIAAHKDFNDQDSWIQSHLMIIVKERSNMKSLICTLAARYWRKHKGTMTTSQIMADYVGLDCYDHPLIEAWKPYK